MSMLLCKHLISQPIVTDKRNEVKTDSTPKKVQKPKAKSKND